MYISQFAYPVIVLEGWAEVQLNVRCRYAALFSLLLSPSHTAFPVRCAKSMRPLVGG